MTTNVMIFDVLLSLGSFLLPDQRFGYTHRGLVSSTKGAYREKGFLVPALETFPVEIAVSSAWIYYHWKAALLRCSASLYQHTHKRTQLYLFVLISMGIHSGRLLE